MNTDQLTEAMHATSVPSSPDLDRITRQGRRVVRRRRAVTAAGAVVLAAAVAAPWALVAGDGPRAGGPAGTASAPDDAAEIAFERNAPLGRPLGVVDRTEAKLYLAPHHTRSVGALSLWAEADAPKGHLAYGARLVDGDRTLRRAGFLDVPVLTPAGTPLAQVPGDEQEPTYVGLVRYDEDGGPEDYRVRVRSTDTLVLEGMYSEVRPGYLLLHVTGLTGRRPGVDLQSVTVRDAEGRVVARGTFPR